MARCSFDVSMKRERERERMGWGAKMPCHVFEALKILKFISFLCFVWSSCCSNFALVSLLSLTSSP